VNYDERKRKGKEKVKAGAERIADLDGVRTKGRLVLWRCHDNGDLKKGRPKGSKQAVTHIKTRLCEGRKHKRKGGNREIRRCSDQGGDERRKIRKEKKERKNTKFVKREKKRIRPLKKEGLLMRWRGTPNFGRKGAKKRKGSPESGT